MVVNCSDFDRGLFAIWLFLEGDGAELQAVNVAKVIVTASIFLNFICNSSERKLK
ncbi:hypothetical protein VCHA54P499_120093 [Vibrio chagasii]|nr:hypothetical protein VCHA52P456_100139 [Vibrio chagasii]CAH6950633.1 hypothetical protein VCHA52P453_120068 [Vibrio chagasii]CAH6967151.1 hypothetical protein VCHA54P499_120093 [Vibrio chagasii]CAH7010029.1 hypothetical protein VCHA53O466_150095 [Vibrio chagasii]CAH7115376.1 hypothetical protein VCHA34O109_90117 [Vibrio chagasii]